jgi:cardiolipin synthase A/B
MAKPQNLIIKDATVTPGEVRNDGGSRVVVSALVVTPNAGARLTRVALEAAVLKGPVGRTVELAPHEVLSGTGEGKYACELEVPLLTDPGCYDLPILAGDSSGAVGRSSARLTVLYRRPGYEGGPLAPDSQAVLDRVSDSATLPGNRIEALVNGDEAFERLLWLVRSAQIRIDVQTYTLAAEGRCGELVKEMLRQADQGVEVNLILNPATQLTLRPMTALQLSFRQMTQDIHKWFGEKFGAADRSPDRPGINVILADAEALLGDDDGPPPARSSQWLEKMARDREELDRSGTERSREWTQFFKGPGGLPSLPLLSYAVHEKLLVVDGARAVVGGRNLEDRYYDHWLDKDLYLEGPVAAAVEAGFARSLVEFAHNANRELPPRPSLPPPPVAGSLPARFVQSRPWRGEYHTLELLATAFQMAQKRILISSQYLVLPDSLLRDTLLDAAGRGVEVHILTNSFETIQEIGIAVGYYITLNYCGPLLEAGARVYELVAPDHEGPRPYLHVKEFLVDGQWAAIGSFNLSIRSCFIESESLIAVPDPDFTLRRENEFWDLVAHRGREITPDHLARQKENFGAYLPLARYLDLLY